MRDSRAPQAESVSAHRQHGSHLSRRSNLWSSDIADQREWDLESVAGVRLSRPSYSIGAVAEAVVKVFILERRGQYARYTADGPR